MLAEKVVGLLKEKCFKLSCAESLTGGLLADTIVSIGGASKVFEYGFVTYSNDAKIKVLNVPLSVIEEYGAISAETAKYMSEGAARVSLADIGISTTGNAGPSADENKPVGLVYIAVTYNGNTVAREYNFAGDRTVIRNATVKKCLELLIELLED